MLSATQGADSYRPCVVLSQTCVAKTARVKAAAWLLQSKKLEAEVLAPMNRWTTAFSTVEVRTLDSRVCLNAALLHSYKASPTCED